MMMKDRHVRRTDNIDEQSNNDWLSSNGGKNKPWKLRASTWTEDSTGVFPVQSSKSRVFD